MKNHSSSFHESDNEKVEEEAEELLEDCWFFGNLLLHTKPRMLRSYSDPCSSSAQESNLSYEETYDSINKLEVEDQTPPSKGRSHLHRSKSTIRRTSSSSSSSKPLVRAPSLPITLENQDADEDEEEIEFSMGKLIRQASLNYSRTLLPPRTIHTPPHKGVTTTNSSTSLSRQNSTRKHEQERINELKTQRSFKELESEELQGFKDLGFDFNKKEDLSPDVVSIIPGLQPQQDKVQQNRTARPYLSEAWAAHRSAPPVPRRAGKKSTDDMKAQIKFWARAVASNVRQEC